MCRVLHMELAGSEDLHASRQKPKWGDKIPAELLCVVCAQSLSHVWLSVTPMTWSPPGSSLHGILQARILEWVALSFCRESSWPRDWTNISCLGRWILHVGSLNGGSLEGISSPLGLLGWLEGPRRASPIVQEAAVTYPHLLPADHVSVLMELPPSSRKSPFHDLILLQWWYLKTIPSCGSLPPLSWRWGERQLIGHQSYNREPGGRGSLLIRNWTPPLHSFWAIVRQNSGASQEEKGCLYVNEPYWKAGIEICRLMCWWSLEMPCTWWYRESIHPEISSNFGSETKLMWDLGGKVPSPLGSQFTISSKGWARWRLRALPALKLTGLT